MIWEEGKRAPWVLFYPLQPQISSLLSKDDLSEEKEFTDEFTLVGDDHDVVEAAGKRVAVLVGELDRHVGSQRYLWECLVFDFPESAREDFHPDIRSAGQTGYMDGNRPAAGGVGINNDGWCSRFGSGGSGGAKGGR